MANRLPSITITGADGLIELLRTLPEKQLLPAVNKGMRAVGSKTMKDARKHLRKGHGVQSGQLRKSLGIRKIKTYKSEGRVVMYMGPRRGFHVGMVRFVTRRGKQAVVRTGYKRKHDPFYIGHLVEFGHAIAGSGGRVKPYPFLRPAVDANKGEFNKQMVAKIKDVLTKAKARGK